MLNVIDEFTREALAITVHRCIEADGVVGVLDRLALQRGAPIYVCFDNGPEFVAQAVNDGAGSPQPVSYSSIPARRGSTPRSSR